MTLQQQYIQNLRDIMADMVHRVMANPGSPWIQPSHTPLMDGYNRPFSGWELLAVTDFRMKNAIGTAFFCTSYQRRLFNRPVMDNEKNIPLLNRRGAATRLYPCSIHNHKLNEKKSLVEENRKELFSKTMMRMHQLKFSPINKAGIPMLIYKDMAGGSAMMDAVDCFIAEMSSMLVALELGLPKFVEPQNRQMLPLWNRLVNDRDFDLQSMLRTITEHQHKEMDIIRNTEINAQVFKDDLNETIKRLRTEDRIPRVKDIKDILTPCIKVK